MTSLRSDKFGKFYVTTAIDYVNGPPHIGHAIQKVWSDVIARNRRLKGDKVWFLTGTDEHGVNVARTAELLHKNPQELSDENSEKFKSMKKALNLSWDDFIRTSDRERHWPGASLMWQKLVEAGDIYRKKYRGLYCAGHEAFVTQKDLVEGKCALHKKEPEVIEEENYFFRLSRYSETIRKAIESDSLLIVPTARKNEISAFIEEGLEDVSFSRPAKDISWGVPVPNDPSQTMYVWCDALTNYLSAIGYGRNDAWQRWWPADLHVLGKDNLRFHAAIWPGMLLSAGLPLPKSLFVHGFITVDSQKISKTIGNVVDPFELVKKYGTDPVRYYLLREIPAYDDGDFSYKKFEERYNGDLANGLGNFASRVLTLAESADFRGIKKVDLGVEEKIEKTKKTVVGKLEDFRFHEALAAIWELIAFGDAYVNEKKPWESKDAQIIFNLTVILDNLAALLRALLPGTSDKITKGIMWEGEILRVEKIGSLFPRL